MIPSLILNAAIVLIVLGCIVWALFKVSPKRRLFYYFTTLSNVLCAIAALAVLIAQLCGGLPFWALLLKYAGTAAVTVTMLTVLLFLGPVSKDWKGLLSRAELFLHLICPLLALVSFLFFEKTAMPAWTIAVGTAPVVLYAILYWYKVIRAPEPRRWEDFYGFNRNGKWPVSVGAMILAAALIAFLLWIV
ncbi:MAG: hypothetical protein IJJ86_02375 [Clostridia bacterium]|nr:hypothetical protein [Clostridia bacterium]